MQDACTPAALVAALDPLLAEGHDTGALAAEFRRLHLALRAGASDSAAAAIAQLLAVR